MDFTLTKEQRDIQKAAREFALGEFLPEKAQEFEMDAAEYRNLESSLGHLASAFSSFATVSR